MYRIFLRDPDTHVEEIPRRLHLSPEDTTRSLERLCQLGLLRRDGLSPSARLTPADPEPALARLMDQRMHELHEELLRVTRTRRLIDALRAEMNVRPPPPPRAHAPSPSPSPRGVEQVSELAQIRDRIDDLTFFARHEILSVEPTAEGTPEGTHPRGVGCLRRGVRLRSVVPASSLTHRPTRERLRELAAEGALIRVADEVSERILVYDGRTAVVPVDREQTACGELFAYESGLVSHIVALFERIWDQSEDLLTVLDGPAATTPTEMERRVLRSMVSAGKDESGARELGISVRTYRRHVADLMRTLGAVSRAQAALLARDLGWI